MKKYALTVFSLLLLAESVSACTYILDPLAETKVFYTTIYTLTLIFLVIANFAIYYLRKKEDIVSLLFVVGITTIMIPITFFGIAMEHCEFLRETLIVESILFFVITLAHLGLWISDSSFIEVLHD